MHAKDSCPSPLVNPGLSEQPKMRGAPKNLKIHQEQESKTEQGGRERYSAHKQDLPPRIH